jgi:hypothetical protein
MKFNFNKNRDVSDNETTEDKTLYHIAFITLAIFFFAQLIILIILNFNMQTIANMQMMK